MFENLYPPVLVMHIIAVMIAVGTVTVTDYLHILGLGKPKFEKRTLFIFPHLSKLIRYSLAIIYISGGLMVIAKPELLKSGLFWTKLTLVLLVTINGFILHHKIFPQIERGLKKKKYSEKQLKHAAFAGSLSVVSWYAIVVLAITKNIGYTPLHFLTIYILAVIIAYLVALRLETIKRDQIQKTK